MQRVQNILEQLLKWRFGQKREKIDERQLFLFAVQMEATGEDVKELVSELEQDQESKPDDDNDPAATATADQPAKPRGHLRNRSTAHAHSQAGRGGSGARTGDGGCHPASRPPAAD